MNPTLTPRSERIKSIPFSVSETIKPHTLTIRKTPAEVFAFCRNFENLPFFLQDIDQVKVLSFQQAKWIVKPKRGPMIEWITQITDEESNEFIAWQSLQGSEILSSGSITFRKAPLDLGTEVSLILDYRIQDEPTLELAAHFLERDFEELSFTELRRLKAYLETGEIPTIQGQTSARDSSLH